LSQKRVDIESAPGGFFYGIDGKEKIVYMVAASHRSSAY
jgi:hypothetical protein